MKEDASIQYLDFNEKLNMATSRILPTLPSYVGVVESPKRLVGLVKDNLVCGSKKAEDSSTLVGSSVKFYNETGSEVREISSKAADFGDLQLYYLSSPVSGPIPEIRDLESSPRYFNRHIATFGLVGSRPGSSGWRPAVGMTRVFKATKADPEGNWLAQIHQNRPIVLEKGDESGPTYLVDGSNVFFFGSTWAITDPIYVISMASAWKSQILSL